ncbi:MAG: FAD-dependent oxidoreductase [Myxococcales bacterium]|nr:MAG: FAD-dependent oxidoreductase [Myxococcales bacterium]
MPSRSEMWQRVQSSYDVVVVGGGICGCGIVRDLAERGISAVLLEQYDLAYGTSSRSSKLVHGGFRYLKQLRFGLVFESVSERRILLKIAPHLVKPLAFLFPIYKSSPLSLWMLRLGLWLYDFLSLFRSPKLHKMIPKSKLSKVEPALRRDNLVGVPMYYDCSTDDARLTLENAIDAAQDGATILTWTKAERFSWDEKKNSLR